MNPCGTQTNEMGRNISKVGLNPHKWVSTPSKLVSTHSKWVSTHPTWVSTQQNRSQHIRNGSQQCQNGSQHLEFVARGPLESSSDCHSGACTSKGGGWLPTTLWRRRSVSEWICAMARRSHAHLQARIRALAEFVVLHGPCNATQRACVDDANGMSLFAQNLAWPSPS